MASKEGAGGEGQEGVMLWGQELPSVLLSSFNVRGGGNLTYHPEHEGGYEMM